MRVEEFLNRATIIDLSFFNFRNAATAAFFTDSALKILKVNEKFDSVFPDLGSVADANFLDVLEQLGVPGTQIDEFRENIDRKGMVHIPHVQIRTGDEERDFSLLSTRTVDENFSYLNGIQGQFVDRTVE